MLGTREFVALMKNPAQLSLVVVKTNGHIYTNTKCSCRTTQASSTFLSKKSELNADPIALRSAQSDPVGMDTSI